MAGGNRVCLGPALTRALSFTTMSEAHAGYRRRTEGVAVAVRDIYLEIEQIPGYCPVGPELKVTPLKVLFVATTGCVRSEGRWITLS